MNSATDLAIGGLEPAAGVCTMDARSRVEAERSWWRRTVEHAFQQLRWNSGTQVHDGDDSDRR